MSAFGTKRTIAALQQFGRYWTNNGQREAPGLNGSAANDPERTNSLPAGTGVVYRPSRNLGSSPLALSTGTAVGAVKALTRAIAASRCLQPVLTPAEKTV